MPRMIELIRQSAVPANMMRAAARGALALPPAEMIEILVQLTKNPVFEQEAGMTLAGWDECSSLDVASDPKAPKEVLEYFTQPGNLRPRLVPALVENPSVSDHRLAEIAHEASREIVPILLASPRVQHSPSILHALAGNQRLQPNELQQVHELLARLGEPATAIHPEESESYETRHAEEIAAEQGKPFTLVTATGDVLGLGFEDCDPPPTSDSSVSVLEVLPVLEARAAESHPDPNVQKRVSTLFRIAKLNVGERIQLAMKGSREERFILVRDGAKVVALAVLESPKLTESEVETFASMRNVQEAVLRSIALKRKFMKLYGVVKALASNPRTPLDVAMPLLGHLMVKDLAALSNNKNINDTLRKLATKLHRQKRAAAGLGR
jgi:hypothetical protein